MFLPQVSLAALYRATTVLALALATALPATSFADDVLEPPVPAIGTNTVATADPYVARPSTTPCTVTLLENQEFANYDDKPLSYAPPSACPGPWAKVVLEADYSVTAGRQYDRTAIVSLGGVNLYFGTTMEPSSSTARAWHVERDVSDYGPLFTSTQSGTATLGNTVNDTYTGIIYGTVKLVFYPVDASNPATSKTDLVVPLQASTYSTLGSTDARLSKSLTLPRNIEGLWLDVIAEAQSSDEFWYTCVPSEFADAVYSCGGGSFREVEVYIDGTLAGVAPIYPWLYTGAIDPYLWFPTPGVQTLNFEPWRVNLTPFAAQLNDGQAHEVALQVYGAQSYFSITGLLIAQLDEGSAVVGGALSSNTLTAPEVVTNAHLKTRGGSVSGPISMHTRRDFIVAGYVETSHGRVDTSLHQRMRFNNTQQFNIESTVYVQNISQFTQIDIDTSTTDSSGTASEQLRAEFPLSMDLSQTITDRKGSFTTTVDQGLVKTLKTQTADGSVTVSRLSNHVSPTDTLAFNPLTGSITGHSGNANLQAFKLIDTAHNCYFRSIEDTDNAVSAVEDACTR